MSLLDEFGTTCVLMEKTRQSDGAGGYIQTWTEGIEFINYKALNTSTEAIIAEKQGVTSIYNILVDNALPIAYQDVFRELESGNYYRVTSDPQDNESPALSSLRLKSFTSERLRGLPT